MTHDLHFNQQLSFRATHNLKPLIFLGLDTALSSPLTIKRPILGSFALLSISAQPLNVVRLGAHHGKLFDYSHIPGIPSSCVPSSVVQMRLLSHLL